MKHTNAYDVFPKELVEEIKQYYSGGYLYIPKRDKKERNAEICALYERGVPVKEIAEKVGLTERRVRQILK